MNDSLLLTTGLLICFVQFTQGTCSSKDWFRMTRVGSVNDIHECLVDNRDLLNKRDEAGCTAVINAAANGNNNIVNMLLDANANVNMQCRSGNTALIYAAKAGNLELCKLLHKKGADIDAMVAATKETALDVAASLGHLHIVKYLHKVEMSLSTDWSGNELMFAAAKGEVGILEALISQGLDIEARDRHNHTALIWAAKMGQIHTAQTLIERGADLNASSLSGWTSSIFAAYNGHTDMLKLLHSNGADMGVGDKIGFASAHWSASEGHIDALALLHTFGEDLGAMAAGWSPLLLAVRGSHVAATKFLLRRGQPWHVQTNHGDTCESIACGNNHEELCSTFKRMRVSVAYEEKRQQIHTDL